MTPLSPAQLVPVALAAALALPAQPTSRPLASAERAALRSLECPDLAGLRGGDRAAGDALPDAERRSLARAQDAAPDLADLRGRGLSDRELKIIGFTVLAVVIIAILL